MSQSNIVAPWDRQSASSAGKRMNLRSSTTTAPWGKKGCEAKPAKKIIKPKQQEVKITGKKMFKDFVPSSRPSTRIGKKMIQPSTKNATTNRPTTSSGKRILGIAHKENYNILSNKPSKSTNKKPSDSLLKTHETNIETGVKPTVAPEHRGKKILTKKKTHFSGMTALGSATKPRKAHKKPESHFRGSLRRGNLSKLMR
eukprot:jgi/Bigna1/146296/aug1.112_g21004